MGCIRIHWGQFETENAENDTRYVKQRGKCWVEGVALLIESVSLISSCLALIRNAFFPAPAASGWGLQIPTGFPDSGLEPIPWIPWCQKTFQEESRKDHFCIRSLHPLIYHSEPLGYYLYSGVATQGLRDKGAYLAVTLNMLCIFCITAVSIQTELSPSPPNVSSAFHGYIMRSAFSQL